MSAVALRTAAPRRRTRNPEKVGAWTRRLPLLPALIFTVLITQIPFIFTIYYSLQSWNLVRPGSEHWVGVSNYGKVFTDSQFRDAAINTVILTASAVVIAMVLGTLLAILLDRTFPGRGFVRTLLITPFLANYLVMNLTLFAILFSLGFLTARIQGINFWILLAYLAISVFVGLNPQQPVDSQNIIDSFIGLMVGMFIGAFVGRLIWPVLPT